MDASTSASTAASLEPPVEANVIFNTVDDLLLRIRESAKDGFAVTDIPSSAFQTLEHRRDAQGWKTRFVFLAEQRMLFVTIPTLAHEVLQSHFHNLLMALISQMGLFNAWASVGAARFPASSTLRGGGSSGEADYSGMPQPPRYGMHAWPTIVVEAGIYQSLPSLRQMARFWFAQSGHDVKVVILIKAFPSSPDKRVLIERWEGRSHNASRPGAATTRSMIVLMPVLMQDILIEWNLGTPYAKASAARRRDHANFRVTGGPLSLPFHSLFLRPSVPPHEHDIIFLDTDLQRMVAKAWDFE